MISVLALYGLAVTVFGARALPWIVGEYGPTNAQVAAADLQDLGKSLSVKQMVEAVVEEDVRTLDLLGIAGVEFGEIGAEDSSKRTAAHIAIDHSKWGSLERVIYYCGDVTSADAIGQTPFSKVTRVGRLDVGERLLKLGADPNFLDEKGTPGLITYLKEGNEKVVDFLLQSQANPTVSDENGRSALGWSLDLGMGASARQLIASGAAADGLEIDAVPVIFSLISEPERYNLTRRSTAELVAGLIKNGADPELIDPTVKLSPMSLSILVNDKGVFDLLISEQLDMSGCVWHAVLTGQNEMLESLLAERAEVDVKDYRGDTPLVHLVRSGEYPEMVKTLLAFGANPEQITIEGQRLLFMALVKERKELVKLLLNSETPVDVKEPMTWPLSRDFLKLYKTKGLKDWYFKNVKALSPLFVAVLIDDVEITEKMIELGANRYEKSTANTRPVQVAAKTKNIQMQQLLLDVPYKDDQQQRSFIVDLSEQKAYFYKDGKVFKTSRVSSGKTGFRTPTGKYVISDKIKDKVSNIYKDAKMPYFQRFSCSEIGFHEGYTGSRFASHGCIRLPMSVAKFFYQHSERGDRVTIRK